MEINFSSDTVQGCSNGSIYHYVLEPAVVSEVLDTDNEINEVLQRKEYRKRRTLMFQVLQECIITSPQSKVCSALLMIPKSNSQYKPMCLTGKILSECTAITDNDIIVVYSGQSHFGITPANILYIQEIVQATGRFCEVVTHDAVDYNNRFSKVRLIVHERPSTKVLEDQNAKLKQKVAELEKRNNDLEDMIALLEVNQFELDDIITQLTQEQTIPCTQETQFFNIDDMRTYVKDPFTVLTTTASTSSLVANSQTETVPQNSVRMRQRENIQGLAAKAALQRESQFLQSAYGKRITDVMRKK